MAFIYGIGVDIVDIARFEKIVENGAEQFVKRILTVEEQNVYSLKSNKVNYLAKQFSAKEAIAKAYGTGIGQYLSFKDIEILRDDLGKPVASFIKTEERNLAALSIQVSLSDTQSQVVAFALIEKA